MRFSIWLNPTQSFAHVLSIALHAEKTGWDGVWFSDHFMLDTPETSAPRAEAWTTLSALGAVVPRIRIGPLVSSNTFRHPPVLAKMAATLDDISNGRVVLGIGAGCHENEHTQYGIPFFTLAERLRRLEEACHIITSLFSQTKASFDGDFYQLQNASLEPKPVQQPLPLLVGGGGERVTLRIAARYANEWNVWGDVDTLKRKMSILDDHCHGVQRNPRDIKRSATALLFMSESSLYLEILRNAPIREPAIIGTPDEVKAAVAKYEAIGVDELVIPDWTLGTGTGKVELMDKFISHVAGR